MLTETFWKEATNSQQTFNPANAVMPEKGHLSCCSPVGGTADSPTPTLVIRSFARGCLSGGKRCSRNTRAIAQVFRQLRSSRTGNCRVPNSVGGDNGDHWSSDRLILQDFELIPPPAKQSIHSTPRTITQLFCIKEVSQKPSNQHGILSLRQYRR